MVGEIILSAIFTIVLIIIALFLLYWAVKSAINDSELVTLLRDLNYKLDQFKPNDGIGSKGQEVPDSSKLECPACNSMIPIDCSACPECGIVFQDE